MKFSLAVFFQRLGEALLDLLYPRHCAVCRDALPDAADESDEFLRESLLCPDCADGLRRVRSPFCQQCSQPFSGAITESFTCSNCRDRKFHFTGAVCPFRATGPVRDMVLRLKYNGELDLAPTLGRLLSEALADERIAGKTFEAIIPVPLHSSRRRKRGFNQAEELARELGRHGNIPVRNLLRRQRPTPTQTRLDRGERMANLKDAFALSPGAEKLIAGKNFIVLDDVLTTGSTVEECAKVLAQAGAAEIWAVAVARG